MMNNISRVAMFVVSAIVWTVTVTNPSVVEAGGTDSKRISFVSNSKSLTDGYYLLFEFVNQKVGTYSIAGKWEAPPIFSEFSVKRTTNGYQFEGGNLRESLLSFVVDSNGVVDNSP